LSNSYLAVQQQHFQQQHFQQQHFQQQQQQHSSYLPLGGAALVQPQLYPDPFFSGAVQQQQVLPLLGPQHLLEPHQVPQQVQQPWDSQLGQQQQQAQQQPETGLEEPDENFGDLCDLLDQVEQQYELDKQSQHQVGFGEAAGAVPPVAAAEAAALDMTSAPRPYQVVYDRDRKKQTARRSGSLYGVPTEEQVPGSVTWRSMTRDKHTATSRVRRQPPQDRQMVPHVVQLGMPPPAYMQVHPQQIHAQQLHALEVGRGPPQPWGAQWGASGSQKQPNAQLPSRLAANGPDSSSGTPPWRQQQQLLQQQLLQQQHSSGYQAALREFASRHGAADRQCDVSVGAAAVQRLRAQQQPSASARAAAMLQHASSMSGASGGITGGTVGQGGSRNSPEAYFRRHVPQIDPFWASATPDDVGLVGVTQLQPASAAAAAAAGSGEPPRQSCTMSVLLTNSQLGMVKAKVATLQVGGVTKV
jgi:hypothetical protein